MIYHTRIEYTNHYITDAVCLCVIDHGLQKNCIGGVMVTVLDSSVIDHGLKENCIGGVMVSATIYHTRVEYTNHYTTDTVFL
jgi:hypothetical protein